MERFCILTFIFLGKQQSPSDYSYNTGNFKTKAHYLLAWYTENKALWYLDTNYCLLYMLSEI